MSGPLTRSVVRLDHAVLAPDGHVIGPVPGWTGSRRVVLAAPPLSAFGMSLVSMDDGATGGPPPPGVGRFVFVLEGTLWVDADGATHELAPQGYAYLPAGLPQTLTAVGSTRICLIEKPYVPHPAGEPRVVVGSRASVPAEHLYGDPTVHVQQLLPEEPGLDLAVNTMSFAPGASLPFVETHVMEHGLLVLEGTLVYRLADGWYPVGEGDAIWMAPFCPQWCCAYGTGWASYLIYKDWNRDPLSDGSEIG